MDNQKSPIRSGHYERFGEYNHFIPANLPPSPDLELDRELLELYGEAMQSLGKFAEVQGRIPSKHRFLDVYVAKEAVFSSQIENINTTLTQVLEYQTKHGISENKDIQEVLNYIKALHHGIYLMRDKELPISSRLIKECHQKLLSGVRGDGKTPGVFRKVPVFVGKLVPPPANYLENLMSNLEKFINENNSVLPLIRVGLAHVQFEIIHPFLDGNGRIGRLLIVLMMMDYGLISEPVLYPSFYFMKYRSEYYDRLDSVRTKGDYEGWIKYFMRAIRISADDIVQRAWAIDKLLEECNEKVENNFPRSRKKALQLLEQLCHTPIMTINDVAELTKSQYISAQNLVKSFVDLDILQQDTSRARDRRFIFRKYLDILEKEFEG